MTATQAAMIYRSSLLTQAASLRTLAQADERRAAWIERCGGSPADAAWHRTRADERRARAFDLVHRFDEECRSRPVD